MTKCFDPGFEVVMIIDDNKIDLYITSQVITRSRFGQNVLQYSCASDALKYLQDNSRDLSMLPEIILVDIYMPEMSGFEFMEAYDKLPSSLKAHSKVFIVSSSIDEQDLFRANDDKNVIAFQEKPISREFLENICKAS